MPFGTHIYEFLLGIYLRVELLQHRVCICSALEDIAKQFPKLILTIHTSPNNIYEFQSSTFSTTLSIVNL